RFESPARLNRSNSWASWSSRNPGPASVTRHRTIAWSSESSALRCAALYCIREDTRPAMGRSTTSIRLDDELRAQLSATADAEATTMTDLIERFVREGLATARHAGIVFKPGPSGRRAALAGGPDVWEIVAAFRDVRGSEAKRVKTIARQFGLNE